MKKFGGPALLLDRSDINTDEIIPAKYLTEISKMALKPFLLEDLTLDGFSTQSDQFRDAAVIVTRSNFGCGSSREHAVWVLEVNDINVVIGESFARIFRQNMFNCGMLAIELSSADIEKLFAMNGRLTVAVDLDNNQVIARTESEENIFAFVLGDFERELIMAGGWLAFADKNY